MKEIKLSNRTWTCFLCGTIHPNTLLYCPKCKIARQHSYNLFETNDLKNKEKEGVQRKRRETFREKKRRFR